MTPTNRITPPQPGRVLVNHIGFPCQSHKTVIVPDGGEAEFEVQNMALNRPSTMGGAEDFQAVFTGRLGVVDSALGRFSVGDFSGIETPGIYRVVLTETREHSYQFAITDGAFAPVPEMFLRFLHAWRSGPFENAWRGPTHLDDGVRSDDGRMIDAVGGWYDAGDVRKWMVHSNLPALALMDAHRHLPWYYAEWESCKDGWTPWLHEARWGIEFVLKMQDPETGMFYEDVGGGREGRKQPGMLWFYENHSGCYADNADNRFTDNLPGSGDERPVRIQFNPIVQFTSVCILARAAGVFAGPDPALSARCRDAASRGWKLGLSADPKFHESPGLEFERWTSVRSWRCLAAVALHRAGLLDWHEVGGAARDLLAGFSEPLGFWVNREGDSEPYRGILHSAQPVIALCEVLRAESAPEGLASEIRSCLRACLDRYVLPLAGMSPFGFVPFGIYGQPASEGDTYRPWRDGRFFRFFMPSNHAQQINHGLGGHWMSWAHALALLGDVLDDPRATTLAWSQIHWVTGQNLHNACLISGLGFNNPMPHSRLLGTFPGGFCSGFIGTPSDTPHLDTMGDAQWNTTEYWATPQSNLFMALTILLQRNPAPKSKLGSAPPPEPLRH